MEASCTNLALPLPSPHNTVCASSGPTSHVHLCLLQDLFPSHRCTGSLREETPYLQHPAQGQTYIRCFCFLNVGKWREAPEGSGSILQRLWLLGPASYLVSMTNSLSSFPVLKAIFPTRRCPQQECCHGSREFSAMWTILVFKVPPQENLLELCQTITTPCKCWDSHRTPFILLLPWEFVYVRSEHVLLNKWSRGLQKP